MAMCPHGLYCYPLLCVASTHMLKPRGLAHILFAARTETCEVLPCELQADLQLVPTFIELQLLQQMPKCTKHPEDEALMITAIANLGRQASKRLSSEVEDSSVGPKGPWVNRGFKVHGGKIWLRGVGAFGF